MQNIREISTVELIVAQNTIEQNIAFNNNVLSTIAKVKSLSENKYDKNNELANTLIQKNDELQNLLIRIVNEQTRRTEELFHVKFEVEKIDKIVTKTNAKYQELAVKYAQTITGDKNPQMGVVN